MKELENAIWSRFSGRLLGYIENYYNRFIQTDYEIQLDMTMGEVLGELQQKSSISFWRNY